jgi:hypothetical protein
VWFFSVVKVLNCNWQDGRLKACSPQLPGFSYDQDTVSYNLTIHIDRLDLNKTGAYFCQLIGMEYKVEYCCLSLPKNSK